MTLLRLLIASLLVIAPALPCVISGEVPVSFQTAACPFAVSIKTPSAAETWNSKTLRNQVDIELAPSASALVLNKSDAGRKLLLQLLDNWERALVQQSVANGFDRGSREREPKHVLVYVGGRKVAMVYKTGSLMSNGKWADIVWDPASP